MEPVGPVGRDPADASSRSDPAARRAAAAAALVGCYDAALPQVYGYLLRRCGGRETAEELTSETFLAAAAEVRRPDPPLPDPAWLIGIARHKLADHWRRQAREQRNLHAVAAEPSTTAVDDPWNDEIDAVRAAGVLAAIAPQHRLALTLRYTDDLPVPQVAQVLDRTVHATEALLVRARRAFRTEYLATAGEGDDRA